MSELPYLGRVEGPLSGWLGAVAGSCLIGSIVFSLAFALGGESSVGWNDLMVAPFIFLIAFPGALPIVALFAIIVGLPFSRLVARLKLEGALTYGLGGLLLGLFLLLPIPRTDNLGNALWLSGGVYGSTCGLLWWRIYRRWCL
jgi:hypothetical protein